MIRKKIIQLILVVISFIPIVSFSQLDVQTFTTSTTWTVPACVTSIQVEAWGGGGAGGGGAASNCGGGGGGAYAMSIFSVTPGETYTITIGAGGVAAVGNGGDGSNSTFIGNAGTVVAAGGKGGLMAGGGGSGGQVAACTYNYASYAGGNGAAGTSGARKFGGGGGASAGRSGAGGDGKTSWNCGGIYQGYPPGGAAPGGGVIGGHGGGTGKEETGPPAVGDPGGGGGGGSYDGNTGNKGAAGGAGKVIINWGRTLISNQGVIAWTAPASVTSVVVQCWGGGGGGAGQGRPNCPATDDKGAGAGGGGGAYATAVVSVIPGTTYTLNVGAGGTGGQNGTGANKAAGANGGDTWFSPGDVGAAMVKAVGGGGAVGVGNTTGANGGAASSCIPTTGAYSGGNGGNGLGSTVDGGHGGGGGSSAGSAGNGNNGENGFGSTSPTPVPAALGGAAPAGDGCAGANGGVNWGLSYDANNFGAGGGGSSELGYGGNGANGQIYLSYQESVTNNNYSAGVPVASHCSSEIDVPIHAVSLIGQNEYDPGCRTLNITGFSFVTTGNYLVSDIDYFKLYVTNTSTFSNATLVSTSTVVATAGTQTFPSFTYNIGNNSVYFWVAADLSATAGGSRTIGVNSTTTGNITLSNAFPFLNLQGTTGSASGTITFIDKSTATVSGSQTICPSGTATVGVGEASSTNGTIAWTEDGAGSITAGATGLTPTYTAAVGDAGNTVTLTMTVSNSVCSATDTYSVIVDPVANILLTSAVGTDSQSVCLNDNITAITYTITGATSAMVTGLPAGVSGTYLGGEFTISGAPSVSGVFDYTLTTTGPCVQASTTGSIRVGLSLSSPVFTNSQVVCKNEAITNITYAIGGSGINATTIGLPAGVTGVLTSSGMYTISGTPSVEGSFNYSITTTGSCASQSVLTGNIKVGIGLVTAGTDNQIVCKNSAITDINYAYAGGGTPTVIGLPAGVTSVVNGTNDTLTISGTPTMEGAYTYSISTTGSCASQSTLTGNIKVGIGLVINGTDNQIVCKNSAITDINYAYAGGGTPTVTGLPAGVTSVVNGTNDTLTIIGTPTMEGAYTYSITTTGSCASQSTLTGHITVGIGLVTKGTDNQNTCKNSAIADIKYSYAGGGTPIVNGLPAGVTSIVNGTNDTLTISGTPTVEGTYNYTVTTNGGNCIVPSNLTGIITVGLGLDSTSGNPIQSVCIGDNIQPIIYNVVGDSASVIPSLPLGVNGVYNNVSKQFVISGSPLVEGIFNFTVTTSVGTCSTPSNLSGTISTGLNLKAPESNVQRVCKQSSIYSIDYDVADNKSPIAVGLPPGVTTSYDTVTSVFSIYGAPTIEGIYEYTVTTTGSCAVQSSQTGKITVGIGLVNSGANIQRICKNDSIITIVYSISDGITPLVKGLPLGVTSQFDSTSYLLSISGVPASEGSFDYTVTTNGSCAFQSSAYGNITIGMGVLTPATDTQYVCNGSPISDIVYTIVGGGTPIVAGLPSGVTGSFGTPVDSTVFTISGTPSVDGTFNYSITTTGSCTTQSSLYGSITVGGGLIIPGGNNVQYICKGGSITPIKYTIVGGSASLSGLPAGFSGSMTTVANPGVFTISGTGNAEGIYTYTVSTSGGFCTTASAFTGTITVGGGLTKGGSNSQYICKADTIVPINYVIVGGNATLSGLPAGFSGNMSTAGNPGVYTISGTGNVEGIYNYTVSTNNGTCSTPSSFTGKIVVGGGLDTTGGSNVQSSCKGDAIIPIKYSVVGGNATVISTPAGLSGVMTTVGSPGVFTISGIPNSAGTITYTVNTSGTCSTQSSFTGTITVNDATINMTNGSTYQKVCSNMAIDSILYQVGGTGTGATLTPSLISGLTFNYDTLTSVLTISGTPQVPDGVYEYTVIPIGISCGFSTPSKFTIVVSNPVAAFTADPIGGMPPLPVTFTNSSKNADWYNWSLGDGKTSTSKDTNDTYSGVGVYQVQLIVGNSQCSDTATTEVTVYDLAIPNVFSPNDDNINDMFMINSTGIRKLDVEIYNRWGTKVYEYHSINGGWDGINFINNLPCESGTYFYIVTQTDMFDKAYNKTGFITLLR